MAYDAPLLPDEILIAGETTADRLPAPEENRPSRPVATVDPDLRSPPFAFRILKHGAYFLQWRPGNQIWFRLNGTMRIERHGGGVTASADLYHHPAFAFRRWPSFQLVPNPDPAPAAGIPVFVRAKYRHYLRVTQILEWFTTTNSFTMKFERHSFDSNSNAWTNDGVYSAEMSFKSAPSGYPSNAIFLEGQVTAPSGAAEGTLSMGWVSSYLRRATLEIDRVAQSDHPGDNGAGIDWREIFDAVGWDLTVDTSSSDLSEPSGQSWSKSEMHAAMLSQRDSADLDSEWRYHLLCVRRIDVTDRGIMYDNSGTDSNNIPREGACIASHWTIPDADPWGSVKGQRFGAAAAPYFRTAVHEIGHAMGLYHNTADNGFMNTTGVIAASAGTFPGNIQWSFNGEDARRLRHMPDPWVRPGMVPFGQPYGSVPISPADMMDLDGALTLKVEPLDAAVPIGAPVRVRLTLTNESDSPLEVPDTLTLKGEHVAGRTVDMAGVARSFRSIFRCIEDHRHEVLKPSASMTADMTLLRGAEGALFPAAGMYRVVVDVTWQMGGLPVRASAGAPVMVTPPVDEGHGRAAMQVLSSADLLLTLAIGGDHLEDGTEALKTAMADKTLAPHYAVIEAKRLGRSSAGRQADPKAAIAALSADAVMSPSEARSVAEIAGKANPAQLKKAGKEAIAAIRKRAAGDGSVAALIKKAGM